MNTNFSKLITAIFCLFFCSQIMAGEGYLSCHEAMTYLEVDCSKGIYQSTIKERQQKDIIFANTLWSYLSKNDVFREKIFLLGNAAALRLDYYMHRGLFPNEKLNDFIKRECSGLEIWTDANHPDISELPLFSKYHESWWTIERFAAFMRYFFEVQKYFSKEENQSRENIGTEYFSMLKEFTKGSKSYRKFKMEGELIDPFERNKHKFRMKSHYSPKGELRRLLVNHREGALTKFKLKPESSIGKMNRIFGLPGGADISGTFVNNMWAVKYLVESSFRYVDFKENNLLKSYGKERPEVLIWMGFLAAMVGQFHHTFNEVAIVLAIKDLISYQAGHYMSILFPKHSMDSRFDLVGLRKLVVESKISVVDSFFFENSYGKVCRYQFGGPASNSFDIIQRFTTVTAESYFEIVQMPEGFLSEVDLKSFMMQQCDRNSVHSKIEIEESNSSKQQPGNNEDQEQIIQAVKSDESDFKEELGENESNNPMFGL